VLTGGVGIGVLLLLATPPVVGSLARGQVALVRSLLGTDRSAVLERRVDELQTSRSASVDLAEAERRRIERDLHDGTQQRLVGLAIDLGIARERLADGSDHRSRELVERAHEGVKEAIAELRDLVRGIHPAVLTDRGLDAAVSALAARSPIPVEVRSDLQRRLPAVAESAAYFAVAEALTNAMKHSRATLVTVSIHDDGTALTLEVVDDGVGGAHLGPTGGLQGLDDRLRALEARLEVSSPPGGPTTVKAVIPCEW
jgi:signal transduction histidine kinase